MKLILWSLFLIFYASPCFSADSTPKVNVFNFGKNIGRIFFTNSGSMSFLEKVRTVHIRVPDCVTLKFVRVKVINPSEVPSVSVNWKDAIVTIQYGLFQYSASEFTIIAKGQRYPFCNRSGAASDAKPVEGADVDVTLEGADVDVTLEDADVDVTLEAVGNNN